MKKYLMSFLSALMVLSLIFGLTGCGEKDKTAIVSFLSYSEQNFDDEFVETGIVCENDNWSLNWDNVNKRVSFTEKSTGYVWGQIPAEASVPQITEDGRVQKNHPQLESVVQVIYQDPKSFDDVKAYSYSSAVQSGGVYTKIIKNGIRVTFDFLENEFSVPVDFTITENSFKVSVDPTKISEGEEFKIHSIALAPFLCGMKNDAQDSWLFIPDGSGAVIEPFISDGVGSIGQKYVYDKDLAYQSFGASNTEEKIHLPVFGAKKAENAIFAVIHSGAETASLNWNIGSANIGYSTVYPEFTIRGFNYISRPENFVTTTTLGAFKILSDGIVTRPIEIEYFALSKENADINGMADCYRNYLKKNQGFEKNSNNEKIATLKYIGAVIQPSFILGVPTDKLFALTTTEQAFTMTNELTDKIGKDINVQLVGFGESGVDIRALAGGFSIADELGNNKGMKTLIKSLNDMKINSFVDFDILSFSESGAGFSKSDAAVYHGGQTIKYTSFDSVSFAPNNDRYFLISRDNLFKASQKVIDKAEKIGFSGVSFATISNSVYSDYAKQKYYIKGNIGEDVSKIFSDASKNGYNTISTAPNDYAILSSDFANDVPLYSSKYAVTSYDVPFYQLVFKGYRPMSSVSVNLCADKNDAVLRCVASGVSPSFTLYNNFESELVTNQNSFIFGSHYAGIKDDIINTISGLKDYLLSVEGATITDYVRINDNASLTKFDNGVYTVVNFSDTEIETEYGKIPAKSYITGREG